VADDLFSNVRGRNENGKNAEKKRTTTNKEWVGKEEKGGGFSSFYWKASFEKKKNLFTEIGNQKNF